MLSVSIIGYGYWGTKLARNFQNSSYFEILSIVDKKRNNLNNAKKNLPSIECYLDYKKAIKNNHLDLVIISTPTSSHFKIAKFALDNSKHVLVEKPLCLSSKEAKELNKIAKLNNETVGVRQENIVGFTFHPELTPSPNYLNWLSLFINGGA